MNKKQQGAKFVKKFGTKFIKSHSVSSRLAVPQSIKNMSIEDYFSKKDKSVSQQYFQVNKNELRNFMVIGMVKKQIFCIYHRSLNLYGSVDQHAMHERVRYEYYTRILQKEDASHFVHRNIEKSRDRMKIEVVSKQKHHKLLHICKNGTTLPTNYSIDKCGVELIINQNNEVYLTSYRKILGKTFQDGILKQIGVELLEIEEGKDKRIPATLDSFIAEHACKNAIKFGDQISEEWCKDLLFNAALCTFPWRCVHGRQSVHFKWCQAENLREYSLQ